MEKKKNSRRDFMKNMGSAIGLGLTLPVISTVFTGCEQDEGPIITGPANGEVNILDINEIPELQQVGGSINRTFQGYNDGYGVIIVRVTETTFLVADSKCTHQGCPVDKPASPGETMNCPCHGTRYSSVDASVVQQPTSGSATTLRKYNYTFDINKKILTIKFEEQIA